MLHPIRRTPDSVLVAARFYLLQLVRDHGESSEDAVRGAGDGDDPLRTGAL